MIKNLQKKNENVDNNHYKPNYELEKSELEVFITEFTDKSINRDNLYGNKKYMIEMVSNFLLKK